MNAERPLLAETGRGLSVVYKGRHLYSSLEPRESAERRAKSAHCPASTLIVVPSPLLFYGLEEVLARLESGSHVLCIEADEQLMALSLAHVERKVLAHPHLTYVRTDGIAQVVEAVRRIGLGRFRRCEELRLTGGFALSARFYRSAVEAVREEIESHWRNRMTLIQSGSRWIRNILLNIVAIPRSSDLGRRRIAKPLLLAGAGESLEGAIPVIREIRERVYLLAVDTALPTLAEFGIRPDGAIVLEAHAANSYDLLGADVADIEVFADLSSHPGMLRAFDGPIVLFSSEFASGRLFDRMEAAGLLPMRIPALGSVGIAGLYCSRTVGSTPIFFAGLDFAYRLGKTHARGSPVHRLALSSWTRIAPPPLFSRVERTRVRVTDKGGTPTLSDPVLLSYRRLLDTMLEREARVYDLGAVGLPLRAPRVTTAGEASAIIDECALPPGRERQAIRGYATRHAAIRFLERELEHLAAAVDGAERLLRGGGDEALLEPIHNVDYAYLHFADFDEQPRADESFLRRFIEAADTCAKTVRRALSLAAGE